jgi:hypothetical protein
MQYEKIIAQRIFNGLLVLKNLFISLIALRALSNFIMQLLRPAVYHVQLYTNNNTSSFGSCVSFFNINFNPSNFMLVEGAYLDPSP